MENSATTNVPKDWKGLYQEFWNTMPKKFRRTKSQIMHIRSQAKLSIAIWGGVEPLS